MSIDTRYPGRDSDRYMRIQGRKWYFHKTSPIKVATTAVGIRKFTGQNPAWTRGLDYVHRQTKWVWRNRRWIRLSVAGAPGNYAVSQQKKKNATPQKRRSDFQKGSKFRASESRRSRYFQRSSKYRSRQRSRRTNQCCRCECSNRKHNY